MCDRFVAKICGSNQTDVCLPLQNVDFSFQISTRHHYKRCYFCNCLAVSVNGNFQIDFLAFGVLITSSYLNLLIGDLSFSVSRQKANFGFLL